MAKTSGRLSGLVAGGLMFFMVVQLADIANAMPLQSIDKGRDQRAGLTIDKGQASSSAIANLDRANNETQAEVPDSPGAIQSQKGSEQSPINTVQTPVGTAAAPYGNVTGVTASRPAGAVIAPGKQRRARSILIRVGLILGAVVSVGTVAALSFASPSHSK